MTLPTNGITADVIREIMPPYRLDTDLIAAMFCAIPAPPPDASMAWRRRSGARPVHKVAGLLPASVSRARIAVEIVILHEGVEDTCARANAAGLAIEQVCRLRRTASALLGSAAALERSLVRHQQKPVPFFGTVLADGIDIAAIAAGWGGAGASTDGPESAPAPAPTLVPATETQGPPDPRPDAGAASGVVTRLDQGLGWTLDVVRSHKVRDVAKGDGDEAIDAARERFA